jgi:hypothetical protein
MYDQPIMVPSWYELARITGISNTRKATGIVSPNLLIDSPIHAFFNCERAILYTNEDFFRVIEVRCAFENRLELPLPLSYYPTSFVYDAFRATEYFIPRATVNSTFSSINHPRDSVVMPLDEYYIKGTPQFSAAKSGRTELRITFVQVTPKKYNFSVFQENNPRFFYPKYRNSPVIPFSPRIFRRFGNRGVNKDVTLFDDAIGPVQQFVNKDYMENTASLSFKDMSAFERFSTIKLAYDLKGRVKSFWLPSRTKDYKIMEPFYGMGFSETSFSVLFDTRAGVPAEDFAKGREALAVILENLRLKIGSRGNALQVVTHGTSTTNNTYNNVTSAQLTTAINAVRSRTQGGSITGATGANNVSTYLQARIAEGKTPILLIVTNGSATDSGQVTTILNNLSAVIGQVRILTMTYNEESISNLDPFNLTFFDLPKVAPANPVYGADPTVSSLKLRVKRLLPQELVGKSIYLQDLNKGITWSTDIRSCVEGLDGLYNAVIGTIPPSSLFDLNKTVVSSLEKYCLTSDNVSVKLTNFFESETNFSCVRVP